MNQTTDAATALTETVVSYCKSYALGKDELYTAGSLPQAAEALRKVVYSRIFVGTLFQFAQRVLDTAIRQVDWESAVRSLVIHYGLTMPWTEEL